MSSTAPIDPAGDPSATAALRELSAQIRASATRATPLIVRGGGTKIGLAGPLSGDYLAMSAYRGVIAYEPAELVLEVRAGTPLAEIESLLAEHGQMLGCEPPRRGPESTVGGVIAAGFSGPARPWSGALRDHVLGVRLLSATGELLRFGGRVMKNVAGYDVSRLAVGSWGTLGPVATVALRVMPCPERRLSLRWTVSADEAQRRMLAYAREVWPFAGMAYDGTHLRVRVAGAGAAVEESVQRLQPDEIEADDGWWQALRDWRLPEFGRGRRLWRVSVPPAAAIDARPLAEVRDWGGAQRWWFGDGMASSEVYARVQAAGVQGHAVPMFAPEHSDCPPLATPQRVLHGRIRAAFDPDVIFNRGCGRIVN